MEEKKSHAFADLCILLETANRNYIIEMKLAESKNRKGLFNQFLKLGEFASMGKKDICPHLVKKAISSRKIHPTPNGH